MQKILYRISLIKLKVILISIKGISLINLKAGNFLKNFSFKIEKCFSFLNCQTCPKTIFERFGAISEIAHCPKSIFERIGIICEFFYCTDKNQVAYLRKFCSTMANLEPSAVGLDILMLSQSE